jgi:hypothetical protein
VSFGRFEFGYFGVGREDFGGLALRDLRVRISVTRELRGVRLFFSRMFLIFLVRRMLVDLDWFSLGSSVVVVTRNCPGDGERGLLFYGDRDG